MSGMMNSENRNMVLALARSGRIPHTIIIEGDSPEERNEAAMTIAAAAVCTGEEKPCCLCAPCRKILAGGHPDMMTAQPTKRLKSGILALDDLRALYLSQASIKPNEAPLKIYFFPDADRLLREDAQNTLLKVIEEPPQPLLFLFTVEKAANMLPTVRSRAHILSLRHTRIHDEASVAAAEAIVSGIVSLYEYDLLVALSALNTKDKISDALAVLTEKLRLALAHQSGLLTDDTAARTLSRKLDRARIIALIDATHDTALKLNTNVNLQLLVTRLCTRYRRIAWQK